MSTPTTKKINYEKEITEMRNNGMTNPEIVSKLHWLNGESQIDSTAMIEYFKILGISVKNKYREMIGNGSYVSLINFDNGLTIQENSGYITTLTDY